MEDNSESNSVSERVPIPKLNSLRITTEFSDENTRNSCQEVSTTTFKNRRVP